MTATATLRRFFYFFATGILAGSPALCAPGDVTGVLKITDGNSGFAASTLAASDLFGYSVVSIGDLDNDGVPDLAVGVPQDDSGGAERGCIYILFMNSDGTVKSQSKIADGTGGLPGSTLSDNSQFGISVAALGDLDGDHVPDIVVGAGAQNSGKGAIYVLFLNTNGTVKSFTKITEGLGGLLGTLPASAFFGISCTSLGDFDKDGVVDIVVGSAGGGSSLRGAIYLLFLNSDGTVKSQSTISDGAGGLPASTLQANDFFGWSCGSLGDVDGDGVTDIVVGATGDDGGDMANSSYGAVYVILLNANGTLKSNTKIGNGSGGLPDGSLTLVEQFGVACTGLGDFDNDGVPDLAVGAVGNDTGGTGNTAERGAVYMIFLNSDGTIKSHTLLAENSGGIPAMTLEDNDAFGSSCAVLDLDGDKMPEFAVGARLTDSFRGGLFILKVESIPPPPVTNPNAALKRSLSKKIAALKKKLKSAKKKKKSAQVKKFQKLIKKLTLQLRRF